MINDDVKAATKPKTEKQLSELASQYLIAHVKAGNADLIQDWIEKGADVNYQDKHGMTALHHAAARGARPCIRALVNSGQCDYLVKDNENRYAYEIAIEWAKDYVVGRLLAKKQKQQALRRGVSAWVKHSKNLINLSDELE